MRRDPSAWVYREYQIACDTPEDSRMPPTATVEGILKGSKTFISSVARTPPQRERDAATVLTPATPTPAPRLTPETRALEALSPRELQSRQALPV